jgi:hypothetical protein
MIPHRQFHYHASAHALSGELTRPVQRMIEVQAGISLPSTGGVGSSFVENFRVDEVVSFKRGYSHVSGSVKEENNRRIHTTHATAAVEGLNILDVVTADRIVARLSSSFEEPLAGAPKPTEGKVLLVGSKFENLSIAGCPLDVELDHQLFLGLGTFDAVRTAWETAGSRLKGMASKVHAALLRDQKNLPPKLAPEGGLFSSIVAQVHFKDPGFGKRQGEFKHAGIEPLGDHGFDVVDFGKIFLGEVLCQHGRKTLTMLRVELGSPNGGGVTVVEGSSNGWPPWT